MDLQHDIEMKTEQAAREAANAGKKLFVFAANVEAEILKGAFNIATFIPKNIMQGLSEKITEENYQGKQTMKQLLGSGAKLDNIPINEDKMGFFKSVARKYGIDYSLKKAVTTQPDGSDKTQYLVFYKAKDIKVLQAAFKDFSDKVMKREKQKSIKEQIRTEKAAEKSQKRERTREKKKKREVEIT